jgi:hypothetical protein
VDRFAPGFERLDGAGAGEGGLLDDEQHGARVLDGVTEAKPGGRRNAACDFGWSAAEIHRHQTEAAALHDEVCDFERALGIGATADPKQAVERDTGGGRGSGIEGVVNVDQCANLFARGGLCQDGEKEGGAAGGGGAMDLRDGAAREVEMGQAGGKRVLRGGVAEAQDSGESAM